MCIRDRAEEDGTWVYYDRSNDRVTEEWKKSGDNWYWLDDNGEMAVDMLVEDDDDYYYVDANGVMAVSYTHLDVYKRQERVRPGV